jgi:hypothetical protein
VRPSLGFLLKLLGFGAGLFALWTFAGFGDLYGRVVIAAASPIIEALTDCAVRSVTPSRKGLDIVLTRAGHDIVMPLQAREVFSGLIPYLALVAATGGLTWPRRLRAIAIGSAIFFPFHVGLIFLGSFLTGLPQATLPPETIRNVVNPIINVIYGFYGLVGYAALPFLLWFWLAREADQRPFASASGNTAP